MRVADDGDLLFDIHPVCESFEQALRNGSMPRIEEFLGGWDGDRRRVLFQQLLDVELFYIQERGHPIDLAEYRRRFPDYGSTIADTIELRRYGQPRAELLREGSHFGNYTILREIGRGGMGVVYEARHAALDRSVALKVLPTLGQLRNRARQRFISEARAIARLHHGNIVPIFDVGEVEGAPYYAMQLIDGDPLDGWIARQRSASDASSVRGRSAHAVRIALQVARALEYAHDQGVIHRDVKPSNILVDRAGVAWLVDFGLAKLDDGDMTTSRDLLGTIRYMSPERFGGVCDLTSDVYSLGLTLYECVALRPAYASGDQATLMRDILAQAAPRLRSSVPGVAKDLDSIVAIAASHSAADRYANAGELARDLERFRANRPIEARTPAPTERLWRWSRRNPLAVTIVVLLTSIAAAAVVVAKSFRGQRDAISEQKNDLSKLAARERVLLTESQQAQVALKATLYRSDMQRAANELFGRSGGSRLDEILSRWNPKEGETDLRGWEWYFFRNTDSRSREVRSLFASTSVTWHPDGLTLATTGKTGVAIWNPVALQQVDQVAAGGHPRNLRYSPDGTYFAFMDMGGISVYSHATRRRVAHWSTADYWYCWFPTGRVLIVPGAEGRLVAWNFESNAEVPFGDPTDPAIPVSFSPDGRWFASTKRDSLRIIDSTSFEPLHDFSLDGSEFVGPVEFSPDSGRVVAAGRDDAIHIWQVEGGRQVVTIPHAHAGTINTVRWSSDGRCLVSTSVDATVKLWNSHGGTLLRTCRGHEGDTDDAAISPDLTRIASVGSIGELREWDIHRAPAVSVLGEASFTDVRTARITWHPDGDHVTTTSVAGVMRWDLTSFPATLTYEPVQYETVYSRDGNYFLRRFNAYITLHDAKTEVELARVDGPDVTEIAGRRTSVHDWKAGPSFLVCNGAQVTGFELQSGSVVAHSMTDGEGDVLSFDLSPDGRRDALRMGFGKVVVREVATGKELTELDGSPFDWDYPVGSPVPCWGPGRDQLAITNGSRLLRFDPISGDLIRSFHPHSSLITDVAWSPDGRRLATSSFDQSVAILDVDDGVVARLPCHHRLLRVAWSRDGSRLAAISSGGQLYVWDATPPMKPRHASDASSLTR